VSTSTPEALHIGVPSVGHVSGPATDEEPVVVVSAHSAALAPPEATHSSAGPMPLLKRLIVGARSVRVGASRKSMPLLSQFSKMEFSMRPAVPRRRRAPSPVLAGPPVAAVPMAVMLQK
jgi:hypothetical protein